MNTNSNNLLYIGLNGYAGAGKDTVAKILKVILNNPELSIDECKQIFNERYKNPMISATYDPDEKPSSVLCIAYADQLKEICASMIGIPVNRFYMNKSNAWVCINDKFQYTEIKPDSDHIITADEYASMQNYNVSSEDDDKPQLWMSLREILVYIGTYVCQESINKSTFVNIVRNKVNEASKTNPNLKYVVVTDNRFLHELDYIYENNGITVTIIRNSIEQLDNVAEHDLDLVDAYDYYIDNSSNYDDLFKEVWDMVKNDDEFKNITIELPTRQEIHNYLRYVGEMYDEDNTKFGDIDIYKVCAPLGIQKLHKSYGAITMIDLVGGPSICVNTIIENSVSERYPQGMLVEYISLDEEKNQFRIGIRK